MLAPEYTSKPYVFVNLVASVDGKAALDGKASRLGTDADRSAMRTLRSKADAIVIGGSTLRAERLSLGLDADDPRPRPLAVILTNTGELPLDSNLVRDPRQRTLVLLSEGADEGAERHVGRLAEVRRVPADESGLADPVRALQILKSEYEIDILLCEGGPALNRALISAGLAHELFVTLAPMLVGQAASKAPTILDGLDKPRKLRLISAYLADDELFLRYEITGPEP